MTTAINASNYFTNLNLWAATTEKPLISQEFKEVFASVTQLAFYFLESLKEQFNRKNLEALAIRWFDKIKKELREIDIWQKSTFDRLVQEVYKLLGIFSLTQEEKKVLLEEEMRRGGPDKIFFNKYPQIAQDFATFTMRKLQQAFDEKAIPAKFKKLSELVNVREFIIDFEFAGKMLPETCFRQLIDQVLEKLKSVKKDEEEYTGNMRKNCLEMRTFLLKGFVKDCILALNKEHKEHERSYLKNWAPNRLECLKSKTLNILNTLCDPSTNYESCWVFPLSYYFPKDWREKIEQARRN